MNRRIWVIDVSVIAWSLVTLTCAISLTKGRRKIIIGIIEPIREQESGKDYAMRWLDKMERRFGRYAIPNLMYYIIILYALGFVVQVVSPELYYQYLALDAAAILRGEVWRIFTFIIQPPTGSFIFIFFSLYLYYMMYMRKRLMKKFLLFLINHQQSQAKLM